MKPSKPFHINPPPERPSQSQAFYEVVGHRDGPVVARFPFDPAHEEYRLQALACAKLLVVVSQTSAVDLGALADCIGDLA